MNRRTRPRMEIALACHVAPVGADSHGIVAVTENISRSGVLVSWKPEHPNSRPPEVGDLMRIEIELPANHVFGDKCIYCQATVVRVSRGENGAARIAFSVDHMQ